MQLKNSKRGLQCMPRIAWVQWKELMFVSLSLVYWLFTILVPIPSKQQTKHVMTLSVFKNVRILIFGATGSAANILRAPSNEAMGLQAPRKKKI